MKFSIIGFGKIGKIRYNMIKKVNPESYFYVFDPDITGNDDYLEEDMTIVPTVEEAMDAAEQVFICTPNFLNAKLTIQALKKGKNVFCEKPPALNYDELLEVEKVHNENKHLTLIYGFNHRQYDSIIKMKEIIDSEETGKILWMRGRYGKAVGDPNTQGWRADPKLSGGGILLDQGIHMLDLMCYFGGGFDEVQSVITNNLWNIEGIEDNAFLNLYNSEKNISASLHSTMIEWRHIFSLEVLLEKGYVALNGLKTPSGSYGKEVLTICDDKHNNSDISQYNTIEFKSNNTWEKEINFFFDSITNNPHTNLPQALAVMKLIKEAYRGR